jgi:uncharacterized protein (TIGR03435 family)
MLNGMRPLSMIALFGLLHVALALAQAGQPAFEVVSVRPSQQEVGPDYNNQITYSAIGFTGHNITLKRLMAEAWHCQLNQVAGPLWIDRKEYDISARLPDGATKEQIPLMLRSLLADRFRLKEHSETRQMRVYELTVTPGGPRIHPVRPEDATVAGQGFHFRGDMRQFADLLAVQFTIPAAMSPSEPARAGGAPIPVLDKTGLEGIYDFRVDLGHELGTDGFTLWKRALEDQLGLNIDSRKADVAIVVVDEAAEIPTAN